MSSLLELKNWLVKKHYANPIKMDHELNFLDFCCRCCQLCAKTRRPRFFFLILWPSQNILTLLTISQYINFTKIIVYTRITNSIFLIFVADVANSVGDDIANFAQKLGGQDETLLQPGKSPQKSNLSGKLIRRWSLSALFWSYGSFILFFSTFFYRPKKTRVISCDSLSGPRIWREQVFFFSFVLFSEKQSGILCDTIELFVLSIGSAKD